MIAGRNLPRTTHHTVAMFALAALLAATALPMALRYLLVPGHVTPQSNLPDLGKMPLSFEPNAGQTDRSVRFMTHAPGGTLYFTPSEVVLVLQGGQEQVDKAVAAIEVGRVDQNSISDTQSVVRMQFVGADGASVLQGSEQLPGRVNYFIGNDPSRWQNNLPTYGNITYRGLYSGIDLTYSGTGGQLKGTYAVAAGSDPSQIRWRYSGAEKVSVDKAGDLQIYLASESNGVQAVSVREQAPVAWQEIGGQRLPVSARYVVGSNGDVNFALGSYNHSHPLTIDPTLTYSSYLGGNGNDYGNEMKVDAAGNIYVAGNSFSTNFPTVNPIQPANAGGNDAFVSKLNPTGSALIYSTYLGGAANEVGWGLDIDAAGSAYVTGFTLSSNFPTVNAYQPSNAGAQDSFLAKLNPSGSALVYSTYLGGSALDYTYDVAVDAGDNAYVIGLTASTNFPTVNPYQPNNGGGSDVFVTKFNPTGSALVYSTYLGGNSGDVGWGIAVDTASNAYMMGSTFSSNFPTANPIQPSYGGSRDVFVTKLNAAGSALVYSTYLGGSAFDGPGGVSVDGAGNAYVEGDTNSTNFPTANAYQPNNAGQYDIFVTKINAAGTAFIYSTYLGGSGFEFGGDVAADSAGNAYVTGSTSSTNFPTLDPIQTANAGLSDAFVTRLNAAGSALVHSTYLGGTGADDGWSIVPTGSGNIYLSGRTESVDFPVANPYQSSNAGQADAFIVRITESLPATATPANTPVPPTATPPLATPTCSPSGGPYDIAIVFSDDDPPGKLITYISAEPDVASVVPIDARFSTPSLAQLLPYDEVVVFSNTEYHDPVALGNVIADYQDAGGIVIATNANWWGPPYGMQGRWMTGGYTMFNSPAPSNNSTSTLGAHNAAHPLMQGVTELTAFFRTQATLTTGATQVAAWADSWPLVAYKTTNGHTAVGINAYMGFPEEGWDGDFGTLIVNAARWLRPGVPCVTPTTTPTNTSIPPTATSTACPITFSDVPVGHTFYDSVRCLACRGIVSGYADRTFKPNNQVTRGQLAKMVSNAAGFSEPVSGQTFQDVPPTHTFYEFIQRLTTRGYMTGYACGGPDEPCINNRPYFRPGANATRGQTSKIVSNAARFTEPPSGQTFQDVPPSHTFYAEIQRLASRNVMQGYPCGGPFEPCVGPENRPYFRPGNDVTRGQSAKIVANTFFPGCQTP